MRQGQVSSILQLLQVIANIDTKFQIKTPI